MALLLLAYVLFEIYLIYGQQEEEKNTILLTST